MKRLAWPLTVAVYILLALMVPNCSHDGGTFGDDAGADLQLLGR